METQVYLTIWKKNRKHHSRGELYKEQMNDTSVKPLLPDATNPSLEAIPHFSVRI